MLEFEIYQSAFLQLFSLYLTFFVLLWGYSYVAKFTR